MSCSRCVFYVSCVVREIFSITQCRDCCANLFWMHKKVYRSNKWLKTYSSSHHPHDPLLAISELLAVSFLSEML